MEFNTDIEKDEEIVFSERIRKVRKAVDKAMQDKKFNKDRRFVYAHLYGVANSAAILAKKRGLNVEIAIIAGMLHDIYTLVYLDSKKHAHKSAKMAMRILVDVDMFTPVEIAIIYTAIFNHSEKNEINGVYDELLKDADVLQHVMFDPLIPVFPNDVKRYNSLIDEMGFKEEHIPEVPREAEADEISATIDEAYEELKVEERLDDAGTVITSGSGTVPMGDSFSECNASAAQALPANEKIDCEAGIAGAGILQLQPLVEQKAVEKPETDEIDTEISDKEAEDMLTAAAAKAAAETSSSIARMSNSDAAKTYSRDPKQFEAVIEEINQYIEKINQINSSIDEKNRLKDFAALKRRRTTVTKAPIVSADFNVPESYWTDTFYFCKLTSELAELDFEAVLEAKEEIRRIYNITDPEEWPNDSLTLEENREDIAVHEKEFKNKKAFAYSVFNLARKKCFGCFYISPCSKPEYDASITLWGLNEAITDKLYKDVKKFIGEKFEFKNPAFPVFEIPMDEWI